MVFDLKNEEAVTIDNFKGGENTSPQKCILTVKTVFCTAF